MFKAINDYMKLQNNEKNVEQKQACVDTIIKLYKNSELPSEELVFQIVKQTRKNPEPFWTRNVWKLCGLLLQKIGPLQMKEVGTFKNNVRNRVLETVFVVWA